MGKDAQTDRPIGALAAEYNFIKEDTIEKKISQTMLAHVSDITDLTLEQLAGLCNVSTSTLLRFIHSMGYPSYSAFRLKITDSVDNYTYKNRPFVETVSFNSSNYFEKVSETVIEAVDSIKASLDLKLCRRFIDNLYEKKKIYIHSAIFSTIRLALQSDLALTGKIVTFSPDSLKQREDVKSADRESLYLLSYDGNQRSREVLKTIPAVRQKHAVTAVISTVKDFPGSDLCDYLFHIGKGAGSIADLLLYDIVCQYFSVLYQEKYIQH